jgi:hypothetical protein
VWLGLLCTAFNCFLPTHTKFQRILTTISYFYIRRLVTQWHDNGNLLQIRPHFFFSVQLTSLVGLTPTADMDRQLAREISKKDSSLIYPMMPGCARMSYNCLIYQCRRLPSGQSSWISSILQKQVNIEHGKLRIVTHSIMLLNPFLLAATKDESAAFLIRLLVF